MKEKQYKTSCKCYAAYAYTLTRVTAAKRATKMHLSGKSNNTVHF